MPSTKEPSLQAQIEKYEKMDAELRATIVAESAKNEKLTKALAASEAEYVKKLESAAGSSTKPSTEDVAALKKLEYIVEQQQEELKRNAMKIQDLTTDLEEQRQQTEQAKVRFLFF